jgi:hypothetical protein
LAGKLESRRGVAIPEVANVIWFDTGHSPSQRVGMSQELKQRTRKFAIDTVVLCARLARRPETQHVRWTMSKVEGRSAKFELIFVFVSFHSFFG